MKMPGQNTKSLELLRNMLAETRIGSEKKKMFGHETYFLNGYMFAGVFGEDIFVHVGIEKVESSQGNGVGFFEPMGKRMRSYVTLTPAIQNGAQLKLWLTAGANYVKALPEKAIKPKTKKTVAKKLGVKKKPAMPKMSSKSKSGTKIKTAKPKNKK